MAVDYEITGNGYWVEPNGKIHSLPEYQSHTRHIGRLFGVDPDNLAMDDLLEGALRKIEDKARDDGWISITFGLNAYGVALSFAPDKVGKGAIRSAVTILKDLEAIGDSALGGGINIETLVFRQDQLRAAYKWLQLHPHPFGPGSGYHEKMPQDVQGVGEWHGYGEPTQPPAPVMVKKADPGSDARYDSEPITYRPSPASQKAKYRRYGGEQDPRKPRSAVRASMDAHRYARSGLPNAALGYDIFHTMMEGGDPNLLELRNGETRGPMEIGASSISWDMYGDTLYLDLNDKGEMVHQPGHRAPEDHRWISTPSPYRLTFLETGCWQFYINGRRYGVEKPTLWQAEDQAVMEMRSRGKRLREGDWREFRRLAARTPEEIKAEQSQHEEIIRRLTDLQQAEDQMNGRAHVFLAARDTGRVLLHMKSGVWSICSATHWGGDPQDTARWALSLELALPATEIALEAIPDAAAGPDGYRAHSFVSHVETEITPDPMSFLETEEAEWFDPDCLPELVDPHAAQLLEAAKGAGLLEKPGAHLGMR